jgi:hypothetical protein
LVTTEYSGQKFDSLLEAQWAVFFDAGAIPYRYKSLSCTFDAKFLYEPQFRLDLFGVELWFEVFPRLDISVLGSLSRALIFASYMEQGYAGDPSAPSGPDCCHIAFGPPWESDEWTGVFPVYSHLYATGHVTIANDQPMTWAECRRCGKLGLWAIDDDQLWWWRRTSKSDCCGADMTGYEGSRQSPQVLRARLRAENFTGRVVIA